MFFIHQFVILLIYAVNIYLPLLIYDCLQWYKFLVPADLMVMRWLNPMVEV